MKKLNIITFIEKRITVKLLKQEDKIKLEDCLNTLYSGKKLDKTQEGFINCYIAEYRLNNQRYYKNVKEKLVVRKKAFY